ncbi:MAG: cytochrome c biogenesis protein ResB [Desulfobacterales bacterium]|nr:MAG: cytochrome c biogenesis protein ResB [Desulfobacterales bacterium]
MSTKEISADASHFRLWEFFASIRLTIVLLLTLAATSIVGTLIPQNEDPAAYVQTFGPALYRLLSTLGLFDMYHSGWFRFLLFLLASNIVVCSIDRLKAIWQIVFVKIPAFKIARFRRLPQKEEFHDDRSPAQLQDLYAAFIARRFRYSRVEETDEGFAVFGEKGRLTRLGVYVVHLSVVVLLFGGLVSSFFGIEGFVNIPEGEAVQDIRLRNTNDTLRLDFAIRCDDFSVSFYDSGAPKEFRSKLTILKEGQPIFQKDIIVNDPLRYAGINIFQSSYGEVPPNEVKLEFTSQATGKVYSKQAFIGQEVVIPDNLGTFVLKNFERSASFKGHNIGEAFVGVLTSGDGNSTKVTLPLRFPSFDKMRRGRVAIALAGYTPRYYTGLQVTKDPSVGVVYAGFIMIILGCYITFFTSHQQLCVEIIPAGQKSRIMVAGTANKNKVGMQRKVAQMAEELAKLG